MTESRSHASTIRNALFGAAIAGGLTVPLYQLTLAIISSYANKPLPDSNQTAAMIGVAVRTLVMGASVLATALFIFVALGLLLLAMQSGIKWMKNEES
jgi:hypothetical protein